MKGDRVWAIATSKLPLFETVTARWEFGRMMREEMSSTKRNYSNNLFKEGKNRRGPRHA